MFFVFVALFVGIIWLALYHFIEWMDDKIVKAWEEEQARLQEYNRNQLDNALSYLDNSHQ